MSKARVLWMDVLRGLGILLVVLGHVSKNTSLVDWIYAFHMPLFFFSSGWLYRQRNIIDDIKQRTRSIIIPYFSFALFIFVYWAAIERHFRNTDISVTDSFLGIFIASYSSLSLNIHLWFLPCFFLICIVYNILIHSIGKKPTFLISSGLAIMAPLVTIPEMPWCINRVPMYIGYFALGHQMSKYLKNMKKPIGNPSLICRVLIGLSLWFSVWLLLPAQQVFPILQPVPAILGISGTIVLSTTLDRNKSLQYMGKISLSVLCIHGPIYRVIVGIFASIMNTTAEALRESTPATLLITAVTCFICALSYEIIKRIAPWMVGLPTRKYWQKLSF